MGSPTSSSPASWSAPHGSWPRRARYVRPSPVHAGTCCPSIPSSFYSPCSSSHSIARHATITSGGHPHGLPLHGRAHPADGDGRAVGGAGHRAGLLGVGQGCAPAHRRGKFFFHTNCCAVGCLYQQGERESGARSLTRPLPTNHTHIHIIRPTPPSWRPPWPPRTSGPRNTRPAFAFTFSLA